MKVYRIEHKETLEGMWTKKFGNDLVLNFLSSNRLLNMPMPVDKIFRAEGKIWKTGTDSMHMLRTWFTDEDIVDMIDHGFCVKEIVTDEVIEQENQVLFNDDKRIFQKDITNNIKL